MEKSCLLERNPVTDTWKRDTMHRRSLIDRLFRYALLSAAMLVVGGQANMLRAQEEGSGAHAEEHAHHDNAIGLFLGAATHLGSDGHSNETGFAIGLEYARRVADRFTIGMLGEYATTDTKDNYVFVVPLYAHLTERLAIGAGPGLEFSSDQEGEHQEEKTEFLLRFGTIYELKLNKWAVAPQAYADLVDGHWTMVYGVSLGIGF